MRRIYVYFISQIVLACLFPAKAQDSLKFPLKIRVGADVYGPVSYYTNKKVLSLEGYLSVDIDTQKSAVVEAGYLSFKYSQYNYSYESKGSFLRVGIDFNLIRRHVAQGKYYAGIGLRYGLSIFSTDVPFLTQTNYWGIASSSIPSTRHLAHFIEASPGIRTEVFRNFSIGWLIRLRILISPGTGKDDKAISIPGFGDATKTFSPGINYYLIWSIPYRKQK